MSNNIGLNYINLNYVKMFYILILFTIFSVRRNKLKSSCIGVSSCPTSLHGTNHGWYCDVYSCNKTICANKLPTTTISGVRFITKLHYCSSGFYLQGCSPH